MKLENVKVGETYTLAVGKNAVAGDGQGRGREGQDHRRDRRRQDDDRGRRGAADRSTERRQGSTAPQAAHGAPRKASTPKATKAAPRAQRGPTGRAPGQRETRWVWWTPRSWSCTRPATSR